MTVTGARTEWSERVSEVSKELVRRHFDEIWNQRILAACEELMAEEFVENAAAPFAPASPGRVNGPAAMRGTVAWLTVQFPDLRVELESLVAEGDIVVARVISRGTNLGQVDGGPPATGKAFAASQSHWFRVADGKLCEHWANRDDLSTRLQLSVIQPPGPPPGVR